MTGSEAEGIHRFRWEHRLSKNFQEEQRSPSRAMPSQSTALRRAGIGRPFRLPVCPGLNARIRGAGQSSSQRPIP